MRVQSNNYNPFSAVRKVDIQIGFGLFDVSAKNNATVLETGGFSFSRADQTINENYISGGKYTALEHNSWGLDGTVDLIPDNVESVEIGMWSNVSNRDSRFDNQNIKYEFSAPVSTIGWTLYFDSRLNQYPTEILVSAFDSGGNIIYNENYKGNGHTQVIQAPVQNYSSVIFEFLENSLPLSSVRLLEVEFGIYQRFNKDNIEKAELIYGVNISADSFPSRQLLYSFDNSDKSYNLLNPSGLYAYLQEGQEITAKIYIDGEPVDMGHFYFQSAEAVNSAVTARIKATDIVYSLDTDPFFNGSNTKMTLSEAVGLVLDGLDVSVNYHDVGDTLVVVAIPDGTSKRESIRYLAQAAMCSVWVDRDGVIQFADLLAKEEAVEEITSDELYNFNGITVSNSLDKVVLTVENQHAGTKTEYVAGFGKNAKMVKNPCVAPENGSAVAEWLLEKYNLLKKYSVKNRGDYSIEIGDTVKIEDAYKQNENAVVTGIEVYYSGGVYAVTNAVGV